MNEFVQRCRREWRRLRVPPDAAAEMAAELEVDLEEATAEGAGPEEVVGTGVSDPRAFAAAWAAERGVVRRPPSRQRLLAGAIVAFVAVAVTGAALAIFGTPSRSTATPIFPPPRARIMTVAAPREAVWVTDAPTRSSGGEARGIGFVLLIVGLAGATPAALLWVRRRRPL